jgi:hypothetical protein
LSPDVQPVRLAGGWCWFVLREKYCWLVADGWLVLREKYCWLVADKPNEQAGSNFSALQTLNIDQSFPKLNRKWEYYKCFFSKK